MIKRVLPIFLSVIIVISLVYLYINQNHTNDYSITNTSTYSYKNFSESSNFNSESYYNYNSYILSDAKKEISNNPRVNNALVDTLIKNGSYPATPKYSSSSAGPWANLNLDLFIGDDSSLSYDSDNSLYYEVNGKLKKSNAHILFGKDFIKNITLNSIIFFSITSSEKLVSKYKNPLDNTNGQYVINKKDLESFLGIKFTDDIRINDILNISKNFIGNDTKFNEFKNKYIKQEPLT